MNNPTDCISHCTNCQLCKNQLPLVQLCYNAEIFWVGLSAVKSSVNYEIPLSSNTNSGKLINSIESILPSISFYKTNIVKCLPLEDGKIRYPSISEMKNCYFHLEREMEFFKPKIVFLLGKQVSSFVLKEYKINDISLNDDFNYSTYDVDEKIFIPIHHPSFILVYKRKKLTNYINSLREIIEVIKEERTFTNIVNYNKGRQPHAVETY
jgi:uracil-DNA glycosylase